MSKLVAFIAIGALLVAGCASFDGRGLLPGKATLDDVIRHYQSGVVERPTLSKDLSRPLTLAQSERADLTAFLGTLSSEAEPTLPDKIVPGKSGPNAPASRVSTVSQDDKTFHPRHVALRRGERLWIVNNDTRTHNVRIFNPALDFDSGARSRPQLRL